MCITLVYEKSLVLFGTRLLLGGLSLFDICKNGPPEFDIIKITKIKVFGKQKVRTNIM